MAEQFKDLGDFLKSGLTFEDLYKLSNFGNTLLPQNTTRRAQVLAKHRRETRTDALIRLRKIPKGMSPYITPKKKSKEEPAKDPELEKAVANRLEKLQRWQQMKRAKTQAEKEKKKPPFKVGIASSVTSNVVSVPETRTVILRNAKREGVANKIMNGVTSLRNTGRFTKETNIASEKGINQTHKYGTRSQSKQTNSESKLRTSHKVSEQSLNSDKTKYTKLTKKNQSQKVNVDFITSNPENLIPNTSSNKNDGQRTNTEIGASSEFNPPTKKSKSIFKNAMAASSNKKNLKQKTPQKKSRIQKVETDFTVSNKDNSQQTIGEKIDRNEEMNIEIASAGEEDLKQKVSRKNDKTPKKNKKRETNTGRAISSELNSKEDTPAKKNKSIFKNAMDTSSNKENLKQKTPQKKSRIQKANTTTDFTVSNKDNSQQTIDEKIDRNEEINIEITTASEEDLKPNVSRKNKKTPVKKNKKRETNTERAASSELNLKRKTPKKRSKSKAKNEISVSSTENTPAKDERPILADITPTKNPDAVYVSPFVTVSRGKCSARKEYEKRRSLNDSQNVQFEKNIEKYSTVEAGATYFMNVLNKNIDHLQSMCRKWETYKEEDNPPEEACDMIDVAIGQSQLLITKKFEQFRGLINQCAAKDPQAPVTCEDLHGFWDMIYIQVENLNKRFDNLKNLKENNWTEIIPEQKKTKKLQTVKMKAIKSNSDLKNMIKAARLRKKKQEDNSENTLRLSFASPSKRKLETSQNIIPPRRSTRLHTNDDTDNDSPGLKVLRASLNIKHMVENTPTRSILKSNSSSTSKKRTVLFQDVDIENDKNTGLDRTTRKSKG